MEPIDKPEELKSYSHMIYYIDYQSRGLPNTNMILPALISMWPRASEQQWIWNL